MSKDKQRREAKKPKKAKELAKAVKPPAIRIPTKDVSAENK